MKALYIQSFSRNYQEELRFDFMFGFNQFGEKGQISGSIVFENKKIGHTEDWRFEFHNPNLTIKQKENIEIQIKSELRKNVNYKLQTERALLIDRMSVDDDSKELINWKELSRRLAQNETSITRNRIPKKYQQKVDDLILHVKAWEEKIKEKDLDAQAIGLALR